MDDTPGSNELFLFLASTAHDMKNSISVLSGTLESLLHEASPAIGPAYPQMAHMLYQTKRLNDNLMQLLALYKQVGKPEYPFDVQPLEIGHLVAQVVSAERILLKSRGITLETPSTMPSTTPPTRSGWRSPRSTAASKSGSRTTVRVTRPPCWRRAHRR
jgi:two-component system sensor histidine kinase SenX3